MTVRSYLRLGAGSLSSRRSAERHSRRIPGRAGPQQRAGARRRLARDLDAREEHPVVAEKFTCRNALSRSVVSGYGRTC